MVFEQDLPKVVDNSEKSGRDDAQQGANDALFADSYTGHADVKEKIIEKKTLEDKFYKNDGVEGKLGKIDDLVWRNPNLRFDNTPTKEERQEAKETLDNQMSPLVSDADRKTAENISHALLDGNTKELAKALGELRDDPERLKKFVEEINHNLKEANAGVSMAVDKAGNVLAYKDHGSSAVQIDMKTGESTVRPISVSWDGTVTLQPGEVLNADAEKTMKSISNSAVNNINGDNFTWHEFPHHKPGLGGHIRPLNELPPNWEFPGIKPNYPDFPKPIGKDWDFPSFKSNQLPQSEVLY